jgi:hypothetical protein
LDEFKKFLITAARTLRAIYKTYVIKNDNNNKNVNELAKMLTRNGIQYGFGLANKSVTGYNYFTGKTDQYNVGANDLVVNAYQPKSVLLHVLLEPKPLSPIQTRMILLHGRCLMPLG